MEILELIKNRIKLSSLVGKYTKLRKVGDEWNGLCPFHHEKNPSFSVNDDKGVFFCFGCRASGNIIDFVAQKERLSNRDAFNWLADRAGLIVSFSNKNYQGLYDLWREVVAFGQQHLRQETYELLNKRITSKTITAFALGFIPDSAALIQHLKQKGWTTEDISNSGIILSNGKSYTNRRLLIPIEDDLGRVIAAAARSEDGRPPKYINSPETKIFQKKQILFNYHKAKIGTGKVILVEGYFDVMSLVEHGYSKAVGAMGTGFSLKQLNLLWNLDAEAFVMMDGDAAGQNAALRIAFMALEHARPGRSLHFLILPADFDPEEYIKKYHTLEQLLATKLDPLDFILQKNNFANLTPEMRAELLDKIKLSISKIPHSNLQSIYSAKISSLIREKKPPIIKKILPAKNDVKILRFQILLAIIWDYPEIFNEVKETLGKLDLGKLESFKSFILEEDSLSTLKNNPHKLEGWDFYLNMLESPKIKEHYKILQTNPGLALNPFQEVADLVAKSSS